MNNEETKQTEFVMGTLYDMNKPLVQQNEIKLSEGVLNSKKEIIKNYIVNHKNNNYYFLCNHETRNYTMFNMGSHDTTYSYEEKAKRLTSILVDECLVNRGEIRGIDYKKEFDSIEIWISTEEESYVYYFFPYDEAVIEMHLEMEV